MEKQTGLFRYGDSGSIWNSLFIESTTLCLTTVERKEELEQVFFSDRVDERIDQQNANFLFDYPSPQRIDHQGSNGSNLPMTFPIFELEKDVNFKLLGGAEVKNKAGVTFGTNCTEPGKIFSMRNGLFFFLFCFKV